MFNIISRQGNANQNHNKIPYHTHRDCYSQKTIKSVSEDVEGLPWWSSEWDSALPMQGARVPSLVGELDPTCMPQLRVRMPQLRPGTAKINK